MLLYFVFVLQIDRFSDDVYSFDFQSKTWTYIRTKVRSFYIRALVI